MGSQILHRRQHTSSPGIMVFQVILIWFWICRTEAKQVVVGNQMGWTNYDLRSFKVPNYGEWAMSQDVTVGDEVVFKYVRGMHNVNLLASREAFLSCDFSKARVLDAGASGEYVWKASRSGVFYFGCNREVEEEGNHCGSGQKLALVVRGSSAGRSRDELALSTSPSASPLAAEPPITSWGSPAITWHASQASQLAFIMSALLLLEFARL